MSSSALRADIGQERAHRGAVDLKGMASVRAQGIPLGQLGGLARVARERMMRAELARYRALYGPLPELDPRDGYPAYIHNERDRD